MRAVLQRVSEASVSIDGKIFSRIGRGLLVYLGIHRDDTLKDSEWIRKKVIQARIFENEQGKLSLSVKDVGGEILVISQITLYGDMKKGNRPDMSVTMPPAQAKELYEDFVLKIEAESALVIHKGQFAARMDIRSVNAGPITLTLDSC